MIQLAVHAVLFLFIIPSSAHAQPLSQKATINELVEAFADAYLARALDKLDAERAYWGKVRIVIEHSLLSSAGANAEDRYEIREFKTFAQVERWLRNRGEIPYRAVVGPRRCKKGLCTYDPGALSHSYLYLKKIAYGYRKGRPYIKTVYLLDGD